MILQALCDYYARKSDKLPPFGFQEKQIPFTIVLDSGGHFIQLKDNRYPVDKEKKSLETRSFHVPRATGRSGSKSWETTYWLWDHYGYVIAQPKLENPDAEPSERAVEDAQRQHESFRREVSRIAGDLPDDTGVQAVRRFLESTTEIEKLKVREHWRECLKIKGCNLTFQLAGETHLVCQSPAVIDWVKRQPLPEENIRKGLCLVTGEQTDIMRLHDAVSGITQAPKPLAAINAPAYNSHGKNKGFNFPVGAQASFQYATALNHLLRKLSPNKFRVTGTSYVCWSERQTPLERNLPVLFSDQSDDPDQMTRAVKGLFGSIPNGAYQHSDGQQKFFLLGVSPNPPARIVVRYWKVGTVAEFSQHIGRWFKDLDLVGCDHYGYPGFQRLLRSTALLGKDDNIPSNLSAGVLRSILEGRRLPEQLLQAVIRRIRAEQGKISYYRACIIKACLNRNYRISTSNSKEVNVSLNKDETRPGYCLGRLFAVLEKLQQDAQPGINATIKDRYYSSASSTPQVAFGTLMRLSTYHMKKLEKPGWRVNADKRIQEIMAHIAEFPPHLDLENQGLFAIGYYHQKQDLFTKKADQGEAQ